MSDTPERDEVLAEDLEITEDEASSVKGGHRKLSHHERIMEDRKRRHVR